MKKFLPLAVLAVLLGAPGVVRAQEHVHIPPPPPPPPPPPAKVEAPKPAPKPLTAAEIVTAAFTTAHVGNIVYLQGGTGPLSATRREIVARVLATEITVDATVSAGTGITLS